jgi:hypothetical protein
MDPLFIPDALYGELSEYEKAREDNIKVSSPPIHPHPRVYWCCLSYPTRKKMAYKKR